MEMLPDYFVKDAGESAAALLRWFGEHKRDLPWRRTQDPYAIWISEIMLQQTRVAAVLDHYARWMERFPAVAALAAADEPEVLALWSGLGYYRRARMLHRAARAIVAEHGGMLPRTAEELARLPGIGDYTSAAIASIAFGEPIAVVDGNVERVITRLAALAPGRLPLQASVSSTQPVEPVPGGASLKRAIRAGATALLVAGRAGDSNQALMELGATVCLPKAPLCLHCPVQPWCRTRGEHVAVPRARLVNREVAFALVEQAGAHRVLLRQRPPGVSLMAGMWELPELADVPESAEIVLRLRHAITVTNYAVSVVRLPEKAIPCDDRCRWAAIVELPELALTGLARKVLRRLGLWPGMEKQARS